eukprot:3850188-Rhodomonas_salina.1
MFPPLPCSSSFFSPTPFTLPPHLPPPLLLSLSFPPFLSPPALFPSSPSSSTPPRLSLSPEMLSQCVEVAEDYESVFEIMKVSSYAPAMRCPVLTEPTVLHPSYPMSGTDIADHATRAQLLSP